MIKTFITDKDPIIRFDEQELTLEQQAQTRTNIGAVSLKEVEELLGVKEEFSVSGELV
jgi:hypothetical protein